MSWSQFANLIREDNRDVAAWKVAIEGNPNTPEAALKIAINHFIQCGDVAAIDDLCSFVVSLVNKAVEHNAHLTGLHCPACMCRNEEIVTCARCGTLKSAPQVA